MEAARPRRSVIGVTAEVFVWLFAMFMALGAFVLLLLAPGLEFVFSGKLDRSQNEIYAHAGSWFGAAVVFAGIIAAVVFVVRARPNWFAPALRAPSSPARLGVVAVASAFVVVGPFSLAWLVAQEFSLKLHGAGGDALAAYGQAVNAAAAKIEPLINAVLGALNSLTGSDFALQPNWGHCALAILALAAPIFIMAEFRRPKNANSIDFLSLWWIWPVLALFILMQATRRPVGFSFLALYLVTILLSLYRGVSGLLRAPSAAARLTHARAFVALFSIGVLPLVAAAAILWLGER